MWFPTLSVGVLKHLSSRDSNKQGMHTILNKFWSNLILILINFTTLRYVTDERLGDFYIGVGTNFDVGNQAIFDPTTYSTCWYQELPVAVAETRIFTCTAEILGRFVTIYFPVDRSVPLTLCEVQVTTSSKQLFLFAPQVWIWKKKPV